MTKHFILSVIAIRLAVNSVPMSLLAAEPDGAPVPIGSRVEMFVDDWLIDSTRSPGNVSLQLQPPVKHEIVLVTDKPWEGPDSAYFTVFQDGPRVRLYYRGIVPAGDTSTGQVTCYAESTDGIHFTRPNLGLVEFQGSKENNIIYRGLEAHNFAPFRDANPSAGPEARYKALAGLLSQRYAFVSPDGIHWKKLPAEPVMTKGAFDSLNLSFWDERTQDYRCYSRYFDDGVRAIQSCTSTNFIYWTDPVPNRYPKRAPKEHFYISEHYEWPDNRLRRLTVRRHGFASVHAGAAGGDFTTRLLTFTGKSLILNYATSAAGALQVEVQDEQGKPIEGRTLADMPALFGDELDAVVTWKSGGDLSDLVGKPVRFRFVLKDADLFALRTGTL